jgi:hypothetical protein
MPFDATRIYRNVRDDVLQVWGASWDRTDIPVFWRSNDPLPIPDPSTAPHFLRNEVDFGVEDIAGFGGGRGANLRVQYGSVKMRCFSALQLESEDEALQLLSAAMRLYRNYRTTDQWGGDLSFIGQGSGFDFGPTEDGNWFMRTCLSVFQYRFPG